MIKHIRTLGARGAARYAMAVFCYRVLVDAAGLAIAGAFFALACIAGAGLFQSIIHP